jgi:hypothetical protein
MNFRHQIEPLAESERAEPRFGRAKLETRDNDEAASVRQDIERLTRLVEAQSRHIESQSLALGECKQLLTAICKAIARAEPKPDAAKAEAVVAARPATSAARTFSPPPVVRPVAPAAVQPRAAAPVVRREPERAPRPDFPSAFRDLMDGMGVERPEKLLEEIEACAARQSLPSDSRVEASIKAAFSLLPDTMKGMPFGPLQVFVSRLLGPSGTLIQPSVGDAFDPSFHHDCSTGLTGSRSRVREMVSPGVRNADRVVIRSLVLT